MRTCTTHSLCIRADDGEVYHTHGESHNENTSREVSSEEGGGFVRSLENHEILVAGMRKEVIFDLMTSPRLYSKLVLSGTL